VTAKPAPQKVRRRSALLSRWRHGLLPGQPTGDMLK
jgi:hypothetical protein